MRSSRASGGLQSASLTSWCATESCTFRARCSMSGSAGRSTWPQKVFPGSRPSKITLCGSTPSRGWSCRHSNKSPRRRGKPPDARVNDRSSPSLSRGTRHSDAGRFREHGADGALRCYDSDEFVLSVQRAAPPGTKPAHEAIADERRVAHRLPDAGLVVDLRRQQYGSAVIEAPRNQLLE